MMPVLVRWVQTYVYCVAPPALRLGSVLPIFGCFHCGSCGRYPYTLRSDWAPLLCCGFGGWCPSYHCPRYIRLVVVAATMTDAGRNQGPYLLFAETQIHRYLQQGHHTNISVSIASLRVVSIPPLSPTPPPSAALSTDNKQHVY